MFSDAVLRLVVVTLSESVGRGAAVAIGLGGYDDGLTACIEVEEKYVCVIFTVVYSLFS